MSDTFLPGSGFDTYETQDKVLVSMDGSIDCGRSGAHFAAAGLRRGGRCGAAGR